MRADPSRRLVPACAAALLGFAVSLYLTIEHYTSSALLACPESSVVNCARVTTSSWSTVRGAPVALGGAVFFAIMAVLAGPGARYRRLDRLRLAGGFAGVLGALYFIWVEVFRVEAICLWCTAAHAAAVLLLSALLWSAPPGRAAAGAGPKSRIPPSPSV